MLARVVQNNFFSVVGIQIHQHCSVYYVVEYILSIAAVIFLTGVSNTAFRHLMEFTYTATLAVSGEEEAFDVWKAAEYLQMQEAIKALDINK